MPRARRRNDDTHLHAWRCGMNTVPSFTPKSEHTEASPARQDASKQIDLERMNTLIKRNPVA